MSETQTNSQCNIHEVDDALFWLLGSQYPPGFYWEHGGTEGFTLQITIGGMVVHEVCWYRVKGGDK